MKIFVPFLFLQKVTRWCLAPVLLYFAAFCVLTYPMIRLFGTYCYASDGDGLIFVWNLWWVNKALTQLHCSPWYTTYLHYPWGVSLRGHTLALFTGYLGIGLLTVMSLVHAFNVIFILSYVLTGLTAFWLASAMTGSYRGSLLAGFIFTFFNYHFAHAPHLNLVSMEWIPIFLLCWIKLWDRPSIAGGVASGAALYGVILCDYYYFFYCCLTACLVAFWFTTGGGLRLWRDRSLWRALAAFGVLSLVSTGSLVARLLTTNHHDRLLGSHPSRIFSLDFLAIAIPGGYSHFSALTHFYWGRLHGNTYESSVDLGVSVLLLLSYGWVKRRALPLKHASLWFGTGLFFFVMALGPTLQIAGWEVPRLRLPYALLEFLLPPLRLSGCPGRMVVMTALCAAVICAAALEHLLSPWKKRSWIVPVLLVAMGIEYWPAEISAWRVVIPPYVTALKQAPGTDGVIDTVSGITQHLFFQTIHEKPLGLGHLARLPASVVEKDDTLIRLFQEGRFGELLQRYDMRYVILAADKDPLIKNPRIPPLYRDSTVSLYDLKSLASH